MFDLLITEETAVRLSHHQSAAGKPKKIRQNCHNSSKSIGDQIDDINKKLANNKITLELALKSLGYLIGIKYDKYRL
jgi:transcriptional antiterminator